MLEPINEIQKAVAELKARIKQLEDNAQLPISDVTVLKEHDRLKNIIILSVAAVLGFASTDLPLYVHHCFTMERAGLFFE